MNCSNPLELIRLKCDYPAPEGLESSRTSNGPTQKVVRHPRGMLINYIFTGSRYDRQSTLKVGGIIQHPQEFRSKILQSLSLQKFTNSSGKINRVFNKGSTQWITIN